MFDWFLVTIEWHDGWYSMLHGFTCRRQHSSIAMKSPEKERMKEIIKSNNSFFIRVLYKDWDRWHCKYTENCWADCSIHPHIRIRIEKHIRKRFTIRTSVHKSVCVVWKLKKKEEEYVSVSSSPPHTDTHTHTKTNCLCCKVSMNWNLPPCHPLKFMTCSIFHKNYCQWHSFDHCVSYNKSKRWDEGEGGLKVDFSFFFLYLRQYIRPLNQFRVTHSFYFPLLHTTPFYINAQWII